jgi:hypothetical protein
MACKHFDNFQMLFFFGVCVCVLFYWIGKELFDSLKMVMPKKKKSCIHDIIKKRKRKSIVVCVSKKKKKSLII